MVYQQAELKKWTYLGHGGEATAYYRRMELERVTSDVVYPKMRVDMVCRVSSNPEEPFLNNLTAALLDEFFVLSGKYHQRHVPQPLGLSELVGLQEGYLYEYVQGSEGFPWEFDHQPVFLDEWLQFSNAFSGTGIRVQQDITDADNGRVSKNIILAEYDLSMVLETGKYPSKWRRIDFGYGSCPFNQEKLSRFFKEHEGNLKDQLGSMTDILGLISQTPLLKLDVREVVDRYHKELSKSDIQFFTAFCEYET